MDKQEFMQTLELSYKRYFPQGYFRANISNSFNVEYIWFKIGLIADLDHCSSRIRENDPAFAVFKVTPDFSVESNTGTTLSCIPDKGTHYAMSCRKIGFRKATKNNYEELLTYMDKYFQKMRKFVDENKHEIYHVETYPVHYLRAPTKLERALK